MLALRTPYLVVGLATQKGPTLLKEPMTMHIQCLRIAVFGAAAVLSPAVLFSQMPLTVSQLSQQPSQQPGPIQPGGMPGGTTGATQDSVGSSGVTTQMMRDKMFLRKAAEGGIAEVQFGQLASQKGSSDDVKAFGQKMVTDHTALNDNLKPIADSMGVMLPKKLSKENQAEYDKLNGLSGTDFDTEYLTLMVKDHHKDLHEFRVEFASVTDPTLKAAVADGQKVIREHMMIVDKLARDKGVPVPEHGGRPAPPPPAS